MGLINEERVPGRYKEPREDQGMHGHFLEVPDDPFCNAEIILTLRDGTEVGAHCVRFKHTPDEKHEGEISVRWD